MNNYKIAIILLSHLGFEYLDFFLKQFNNDDRFSIYIHRDSDFELNVEERSFILNKYSNVKDILSYRHIKYRYFNMIETELDMLKYTYSDDNEYYCLMSEQTFLCKSLDFIYNELNPNNNIQGYIEITHRDKDGLKIKLFKEPVGNNYFNWVGSQWFIFKKDLVKIILNKVKDISYVEYLKNKQGYHCADESFFQNMISTDNDLKNLKYENGKTFVCWDKYLGVKRARHSPINLIERYINEYISLGINEYFFFRKCDFKVKDEMKVIEYFKRRI